MIVDRLENWKLYSGVHAGLDTAFEFLKKAPLADLADGRHEISGEAVYALAQSYTTDAKGGQWEAHRKYIDIQFVAGGRESVLWASVGEMAPSDEYNEKKDVIHFAEADGTPVHLAGGYFAVLFPDDAHKPKCVWGGPKAVKKIVVKVRM